jgi:hypothetical protein
MNSIKVDRVDAGPADAFMVWVLTSELIMEDVNTTEDDSLVVDLSDESVPVKLMRPQTQWDEQLIEERRRK